MIKFEKYHGLGNDFIIVMAGDVAALGKNDLAVKMCDRYFGIGGDGLVTIEPLGGDDFAMRIYNSDGSEARMCGNATRCVAKFIGTKTLSDGKSLKLHTISGIVTANLEEDGQVRVDMGTPKLDCRDIPIVAPGKERAIDHLLETPYGEFAGSAVSMGNPHFVIFVADMATTDVASCGSGLENHPAFPDRCNIEFAQVVAPGRIRMRVWERGCGITKACGTGSCATLVAAALTGRSGRAADIELDGGVLRVEWDEKDNHIYMTGAARRVFEGVYYQEGEQGR